MPAMLRPKTRAERTLAPVHPNAGLEMAYRRRLLELVDGMAGELAAIIERTYQREEPAILAGDAAPSVELRRQMRRVAREWLRRFDRAAPELAAYFATEASERADGALMAILRKAGIAVQLKLTPAMRDALAAAVTENVGLIRSIAQQHLNDVEGMVMRSVQLGRDLGQLAPELQRRYQLTKRRAALIARDQNNKATAVVVRTRQRELGIRQARWVHSHAGKQPRPSHVAFADGREGGPYYDVDRGAFIDGEWIFPGQLINCRCVSRSVIPGFAV